MFAEVCAAVRNSVYGIVGTWQPDGSPVSFTNGTGFMIAPGILVTVAHLVHRDADVANPTLQLFEVIRAPDIGQRLETAVLIAEDIARDMALLRIDDPRSEDSVTLATERVELGNSAGSLGFPLATVRYTGVDKVFHLVERFQGMSISALHTMVDEYGREFTVYETDAPMYRGSSGCPGFLLNEQVFGMHVKSVVSDQEAPGPVGARLAISTWVPSMSIAAFAVDNGITV